MDISRREFLKNAYNIGGLVGLCQFLPYKEALAFSGLMSGGVNPPSDVFSSDESWNFDAGSLSPWTADTDTGTDVSVNSDSAQNSTTNGVDISYTTENGNDVYIYNDSSSHYTDMGLRFWFEIPTGTSFTYSDKQSKFIIFCEDSIYEESGAVYLYDTGTGWELQYASQTIMAVAYDTEYKITMRYVIHATAGGLEVWNGDSKIFSDLDNDTSLRSYIGHIIFGSTSQNGNWESGSAMYVDEIEFGTISQ